MKVGGKKIERKENILFCLVGENEKEKCEEKFVSRNKTLNF